MIEDTAGKMEAYDVRPRAPLLRTSKFSGGNQQKLVLAREIERAPKVLLVGQPTRGVDIGAIEFIHRRLVALRDAGVAILLVSVELDEIMGLADRIVVLCGGRITGERLASRHGRARAWTADGRRHGPRRMSAPIEVPRWVDLVLVPALAVVAAFLVAGLVVLAIGQNPLQATAILVRGALGSGEGLGFTLYYATNFIFTGLAVAVAFHAGLFNIGGEGQATLGGLGAALVCLHLDFLPGWALVPLARARGGPVRRGVGADPRLSAG